MSATASEATLERAERLESENEELRRKLEVMALQTRIAELERTNNMLTTSRDNMPTAVSPSNMSTTISENHVKVECGPISGLDLNSAAAAPAPAAAATAFDSVDLQSAPAASSSSRVGYIECPW